MLTRQLCEGFDLAPYALPQRAFLSTTTMDHEAAFVMANQARIEPGMAVLDPYAGSGGLLLSAAALGAHTTVRLQEIIARFPAAVNNRCQIIDSAHKHALILCYECLR